MIRKFKVFIFRKFRKIFHSAICQRDIRTLKDKNFVIISNNCWGGEVYNWYKRPYNSPFIGLFLNGPCYIKLLSNFNYYMSKELKFVTTTKYPRLNTTYPIAVLDDIEIHFLHFKNEEEAKAKWKRRTERMLQEKNLDNYYFKICDIDHGTKEIFEKFHKLPFKNKVSFGIKNYKSLENKNHIKIEESYKNNGLHVPNGVKLYKLTFLYYNLNTWLSN
jgi:uncharacterized protein (DUF1919 family)